MNRPCFSLGVLLSSLAVCLFAVGSANSQTELDVPPPCLNCPYAGGTFAYPALSALANPVGEAAPVTEPQDDVDYDLDYVANEPSGEAVDVSDADYNYEDDYDYEAADYNYADYDYSEYEYDVEAEDAVAEPAPVETPLNEEVSSEESAANDDAQHDYSEYDYSEYNYDDYDYSDYEESEATESATDAVGHPEPAAEEAEAVDEDVVTDADYDEYQYDYDEYDYSEYDYDYDYDYSYEESAEPANDAAAEPVVEEAEAALDSEIDDAVTESDEADDRDYEYDEYEYDEYNYDYEYGYDEAGDAPVAPEATDVQAADVDVAEETEVAESGEADHSDDYDYDSYDYDNYDYDNYDYDEYNDVVEESAAEVATEDVDSLPETREPTLAESDEYSEFDNFDYEDYFAEVENSVETEESVIEAAPAADDAVITNEDVDAFDFFDAEAYEPATDDGFDELIELIEEAQSDDDTTPAIGPLEFESDAVPAAATPLANEAADGSLYDLRTTYDPSYDEAMAPTADEVTDEYRGYGTMDHCFGGYAEPYQSDYRCDLADQYQSFYHDGTDPSEDQTTDDESQAVPAAEEADVSQTVAPEFPPVVEPYVALVMDRVSMSFQQFSLNALVAKAAKEVARLPQVLTTEAPVAPVVDECGATTMADLIDCHIAAGTPDWCEWGCSAPWNAAQPVGLGVEVDHAAATVPSDPQADVIDADALEASKASIRDLRTRMNAARQSPPLR